MPSMIMFLISVLVLSVIIFLLTLFKRRDATMTVSTAKSAQQNPLVDEIAFEKNTSSTLTQEMPSIDDNYYNNSQPSEAFKKTDIVSLFLMAPFEQPYFGYELLQALLSVGLRYGQFNIFHYYDDPSKTENALFSVASAKQPGVFDLENMGACSCSGLVFFFVIRDVKQPIQVFRQMLKTAVLLAEDLGGVIVDAKQARFTEQKMLNIERRLFELAQSELARSPGCAIDKTTN